MPCPPGWTQPTGSAKCYRGFGDGRTFIDADAACGAGAAVFGRSGHLASIGSQAEADYVVSARCGGGAGGGSFWMGLNVVPNTQHNRGCCWQWTDATDPTWMETSGQGLWNGGEPNNVNGPENCVQALSAPALNDISCSAVMSYCCAMPITVPSGTPNVTATASASATFSTGASRSTTGSATATPTPSGSLSVSPTPTPTVATVLLAADAIPGLAMWLRLDDVQSIAPGACATNWPARGYAGVTAYVPWNACPYMSASAELNGFRPAVFDTGRSLRVDLNYNGRAEFTIFYLARVTGSPLRVLQADNNWLMGWHFGGADQFYFEG